MTAIPVHTEIEDPLDRLRAICRDAQIAKATSDLIGKELARDLLQHVPSAVVAPILRHVKLPGMSLIVSNVRGPDVPLYMAGARLLKYAPVSIALDGMGMNITGFSYAGTMCLCAISCRDMLPDPAFFADCMRTSFEQMKEAAVREAAFVESSAASMNGADVIEAKSGRASGTASRSRRGRTRRQHVKPVLKATGVRRVEPTAKSAGRRPVEPIAKAARGRRTVARAGNPTVRKVASRKVPGRRRRAAAPSTSG
jgi:hypothetical protein